MKKIVSFVLFFVLISSLCACGNTSQTEEKVIGSWVSYDWGDGPNSGIILNIEEDGTCSRYFYKNLNSSYVAGVGNRPWDCKGSTFIGNIGESKDKQFELVYNKTADTLTESVGNMKRVFVRNN